MQIELVHNCRNIQKDWEGEKKGAVTADLIPILGCLVALLVFTFSFLGIPLSFSVVCVCVLYGG